MISNNLKNVEIMNVLGIKNPPFTINWKIKAIAKHKNWILKKNNNISINSRTLEKLDLHYSIKQAKRNVK